ncbi:glycosyl hydrolase family 38 protein [Ancylostoma ceylanicum]|uniref:Glycosyl hydrolase family 38 protein n=1 Tax=Ancylostoma ceylanicum TaxID=53326 RepID=A0A0D6M6E3_9BILA|nr:glycosyl hydrolase family 38 protein [Ancylostoma ceylanicum]
MFRFSFAETGFLWRWYNGHSDFEKHKLQKLVKTGTSPESLFSLYAYHSFPFPGQIEMIGGGWVQNDEAACHYVDIVDQMTLGLKKLDQLFGECGRPKVAWQIDPFGHSKEQANLFAMMGFTSLFFARIHYLEKEARLNNKSLEFIWNTSEDLKTQILTGAFYQDNYGPPEGFCFDALCGDDPIMDDPEMEGFNLDEKIAAFVEHVRKQASFLRSSHVMLLMGSDFQYTNANTWYTNLDKLIRYVNGNVSFYKLLRYASSNRSYWTGYFTSRPTFKGMIREASSLLQLCKQLDALADLGPADDADVETMARASALAQHHDAVTLVRNFTLFHESTSVLFSSRGTAKENVTRDYERRLAVATKEGEVSKREVVINDYLKKIYPKGTSKPPRHFICPLLNETICNVIKDEPTFAVTVFNSNAKQYSGFVTVPYYSKQAMVMNPKGERVAVQLMKTFQVSSMDTAARAPYELVIPVQIAPLGYATYIVDNSTSV